MILISDQFSEEKNAFLGAALGRLGSGIASRWAATPLAKQLTQYGASRAAGNAGLLHLPAAIGRGVTQSLSRPSLIGENILDKGFNLMSGYQGMREGYEAGGVGGALAGGFGGLAGARILTGGASLLAGRATSALSRQVAKGGLASKIFRKSKNTGGLRRNIGRFLSRQGRNLNRTEFGQTAIGNRLSKGMKRTGLSAFRSGYRAKVLRNADPTLMRKGLLAIPTLGAFAALSPIQDQVKQTTMDAYKHTIGNINAGTQNDFKAQQRMRQQSPDFRGPVGNRFQNYRQRPYIHQ